MMEVLVALLLAVVCVFVFNAPAWLLKLVQAGGIAFIFYVIILVVRSLIGRPS